ncbi:hypothetical protein LE190_02610 [Massilia oculi]|uniref:Uncharacterized protein n=1 Tax=Massilia hydrophila TaxID=3044279 RepID=A0ABS7Y583_9BURK|nr:hypothetical protein [Massilia oculi]MCA1854822.1 hypothetical protein [Massilia oculi]
MTSVERGERALRVTEDGAGRIVGTAQLLTAMPDNRPHRAGVVPEYALMPEPTVAHGRFSQGRVIIGENRCKKF